MSAFSGDYLGFQLGTIHSSELNITRVSTSDRYMDSLIPNFTDSTSTAPGRDGTFYWNTYYTQKPFAIDFAFDDLREEDIRRLRQEFGFKGVKQLIFDEEPYKKYMVKCSAPPTLKYIAFDHEEFKVFKGEGQVNLVAYYPYAISTEETIVTNKSNMKLHNLGDLPAPFKVIFPVSATSLNMVLKDQQNNTLGTLVISGLSRLGTDSYYCIDMRTNLIEGLNASFNKTGNLYNRFITSGDFFTLPTGISIMNCNRTWNKLTYNMLYY